MNNSLQIHITASVRGVYTKLIQHILLLHDRFVLWATQILQYLHQFTVFTDSLEQWHLQGNRGFNAAPPHPGNLKNKNCTKGLLKEKGKMKNFTYFITLSPQVQNEKIISLDLSKLWYILKPKRKQAILSSNKVKINLLNFS